MMTITQSDSFQSPLRKKKMSIGRMIAAICFVVLIVLAIGAAYSGFKYWKHVKDFFNKWRHPSASVKNIKDNIQGDVQNIVQQQVNSTVDKTIHSLQPGTDLSENGIGNKTIQDVKISGKAVLITGVLAALPGTGAKLELVESGSGRLVASMSFGTSEGQNTATTAKLFTVIPGTYNVKVETVGGWNVTILER